MELTCPACHHTVELPPTETGRPARCGNCGASFRAPGPQAQPAEPTAYTVETPRRAHGAAIASLVCGLILCVPILPQVLAVGFGVFALVRGNREGGGRGLALAGIILGALVGVGWVLVLGRLVTRPTGSMVATSYVATGFALDAQREGQVERIDRIRTGLKRIAYALSAYRRDMGEWPGELDVLVPTYLSRATLDGLDPDSAPTANRLVTFLPDVDPLGDRPEKIVAYSIALDYDEYGQRLASPHRWVLLLNGQVKSVVVNNGMGPIDRDGAQVIEDEGQ